MNPIQAQLVVAVVPILGIFELKCNSITGETEVDGLEAKFLHILSKALKFSYTIKVPNDMEWGTKKKDGNWTGLIGMIQKGEADMALSRIAVTEERMSVVDFSYPYYSEDVIFATRMPDLLPTSTAFIRPFSSAIWISLCIHIIVLPIVFHLLLKVKYPIKDLVLKVFGCLFNKPSGIRVFFLGDRMLLLAFYIATFFISASYVSTLLSYLTLPLKEMGIRNIQELSRAVKDGLIECSTLKGTFIRENLMGSYDENIRIIGENIKQEFLLAPTKEDVSYHIEVKKGALLSPVDDIRVLTSNTFMSRDIFFSLSSAVAIKKKFYLKKKLDKVIYRIWNSGLYQKSLDDFYFKMKESSIEKLAEYKNLEMKDLQGAFRVLIIGHVIATIILLLEIIPKNIRAQKLKLAKFKIRVKFWGKK